MSEHTVELDPIRLEIIANGLRSIADECFVALMRSSLFDQHKGAQRPFHCDCGQSRPFGCSGGTDPAHSQSPRWGD